MYLFFDTETTGLPRNWRAPVTDVNNWPRLAQLACLQYDSEGNLIAKGNHIILLEGFAIPADTAYNIPGKHGPKWPKLSELHYKLFKEIAVTLS